jgi:hypothetical protein
MAPSMQTRKYRAQRFPLRFPIRYRNIDMPDWEKGTTINISRTGILFRAENRISEDSMLDIRIRMPWKATLVCQADITRANNLEYAVRIHRIALSHG